MSAQLFVPDDGPTGHGSRFSSLDGSGMTQVDGLPHGERGDTIPSSGIICIQHGNATNIAVLDSFDLFDSELALIAVVAGFFSGTPSVGASSIRAIRPDGPFYVYTNTDLKVHTIGPTGVVGATSWTLPLVGGFAPSVMGISQDETILYFADRLHDDGQPLKRWSTASNTGLPDLVTLPVTFNWGNDILTFADGSLIVLVEHTTTFLWEIRHYSAGGTLLNSVTGLAIGEYEDPEMCVDIDDDAFFWIREFIDGSGAQTQFARYAVSGLVFSHSFVVATDPTDNGVGITPSSCPIVMLFAEGGNGGNGGNGGGNGSQGPDCPEQVSAGCWSPHDANRTTVELDGDYDL